MDQIKVLWASAEDLPAGWPLLPHAHPFYHMLYVRSGKAVFQLDGKLHSVTGGTCVIAAPEVVHGIPAESHSLLDLYEVKFTVDSPRLSESLRQAGPVFSDPLLEQLLPCIVSSWALSDPAGQADADTFLLSFLLSLQTRRSRSGRVVSTYIDSSGYPELIRDAIGCIEKNHTEAFGLDRLASELGYNKRYLCSAFKRATGTTILEFLNHIRIRHAAACFRYNDVPVSVIAQHVGFVTPIHFTRVFKKLTGISPSRFRGCYGLSGSDTGNRNCVYDELLGVRALPLADSIRALAELGRIADAAESPPETNR